MVDAFCRDMRLLKALKAIIARIRAWRGPQTTPIDFEALSTLAIGPAIHRDVTSSGVRVYSVCGACGARLECSATLCEECAQGPHTSTF
jgi:hypothetical protein